MCAASLRRRLQLEDPPERYGGSRVLRRWRLSTTALSHEALNMASIWKLPVLFICENNQFATEVPFSYSSGNPSVGSRGAAYGITGITVDGNDVLGSIVSLAK